jgi:DNA-binding MarR family transcriptional regulator
MTAALRKPVPENIRNESVLHLLTAATASLSKQLERQTHCSATRGYILSTLRGGASLNQNQIATILGFDRTVVHRTIKSLVQEGIVSEKKAPTGRAMQISLTAKGTKYRAHLIQARVAADQELHRALSPEDRSTLLRLLKQLCDLKL